MMGIILIEGLFAIAVIILITKAGIINKFIRIKYKILISSLKNNEKDDNRLDSIA